MSIGASITSAALEANPYPIYRHLRDEEPISWVPAVGQWLITRWSDVREVLLDTETYTSETEPSTLTRTLGRNMLASDGAYHRRVRAIVEPAFHRRDIETFSQEVIPRLANELIDGFQQRGAAELVSDFAEPRSSSPTSRSRCRYGRCSVRWDLALWQRRGCGVGTTTSVPALPTSSATRTSRLWPIGRCTSLTRPLACC